MKTIQRVVIHFGCIGSSFLSNATLDYFKNHLLQDGIYNSNTVSELCNDVSLNKKIDTGKYINLIKSELHNSFSDVKIFIAHCSRISFNEKSLASIHAALKKIFTNTVIQFYISFDSWLTTHRASVFLDVFFKGTPLNRAIRKINNYDLYNYAKIFNALQRFDSSQYKIFFNKDEPFEASFNNFLNFLNIPETKKASLTPVMSFFVNDKFMLMREKYKSLNPSESNFNIQYWYKKTLQHIGKQTFAIFYSKKDRDIFLSNCYSINKKCSFLKGIFESWMDDKLEPHYYEHRLHEPYDFFNNEEFLNNIKNTIPKVISPYTDYDVRKIYNDHFHFSYSNWTLYPKNTLCCVLTSTFNHKKYIKENIESVLNQKVNFNIAHIIADDCSTDGTQEIILEYASKYKHIIPIFHQENNGSKNTLDLFNMARNCSYVSLCDGDDYFTDPLKLQKQVDFLEAHPECALCFHPVDVIYEGTSHTRVYPPENLLPGGVRRFYTIKDLLFANMIQTNSVMYRWRFPQGLPDWFNSSLIPGDWYWHLLHAEQGLIGYLPDRMAVYRRHPSSLYATAEIDHVTHRVSHGLKELQAYVVINTHFKGKYYTDLCRLAKGVMADFLVTYTKTGDDSLIQKACEVAPQFAKDFLADIEVL